MIFLLVKDEYTAHTYMNKSVYPQYKKNDLVLLPIQWFLHVKEYT